MTTKIRLLLDQVPLFQFIKNKVMSEKKSPSPLMDLTSLRLSMKPSLMETRWTFIWVQRQSTKASKSSSILIPSISLSYCRWRRQRNSTKNNKFKNGKHEKGTAAKLNLWSQHITLSITLIQVKVRIHMQLLLRVLLSSRSKMETRFRSRSLRIRLRKFLSRESFKKTEL